MPPKKKGFPKAPTAEEANVDTTDWTSKYDFSEWADNDYFSEWADNAYTLPIAKAKDDLEQISAQIKLDALKAEVLNKQQTLEEKKKIAEEYLKQEAAKIATKKPGNPLLLVKTTSAPGTSHHKDGPFGGVSLYDDADVTQARLYMNYVLGIDALSINGRALEHVLAEVYGFSRQVSEMEIRNLKSKMKLQDSLELQIIKLETALAKLKDKLTKAEEKLTDYALQGEVIKKMDKEAVAKTSTVRRIKE